MVIGAETGRELSLEETAKRSRIIRPISTAYGSVEPHMDNDRWHRVDKLLQAALDVASMLHHRHAAVVYAVRGSRGADINRRNALALADLTALHGFGTLIVTAASDAAGPADVVTPAETDATKQALVEKGCRFVWHDALAAAVQEAIERTAAGDLIVLLGAQGMNQGRRMIEAAG